jgi:hypothetical protein
MMMTDRVFEDDTCFEVFDKGEEFEVYVFDTETSDRGQGQVRITVREDNGWGVERATFSMTPEEATLMKEFLIKQGY